ncbi:hypothetical protein, partial [Hydrogenophaga sp. Root209]
MAGQTFWASPAPQDADAKLSTLANYVYGVLTLIPRSADFQETGAMEITPEQFSRIEHCLPLQRG